MFTLTPLLLDEVSTLFIYFFDYFFIPHSKHNKNIVLAAYSKTILQHDTNYFITLRKTDQFSNKSVTFLLSLQ